MIRAVVQGDRPDIGGDVVTHGEEVRQRLLAAAVQLIPERGWSAVSTRVLAERAGVTP
ncbi:helix-turn-helix domain-containing protein, partial [Kibdelosporangium lantanae]